MARCLGSQSTSARVLSSRPAFGGKDCEGADVEAELCHQRVGSGYRGPPGPEGRSVPHFRVTLVTLNDPEILESVI